MKNKSLISDASRLVAIACALMFLGAIGNKVYSKLTVGTLTLATYSKHHDFAPAALAVVGAGSPDYECCGTVCGAGLNNINEILSGVVEIPPEWDGVSDFVMHVHTVPSDSDPIQDTEDIDFDFEWRSVDPLGGTGKTGAVATVTSTYLQSGGAGAECEVNVFAITIAYTGGNQPLIVGDDLVMKFFRDTGSESSSYSGNIIVYKTEMIYNSTAVSTH